MLPARVAATSTSFGSKPIRAIRPGLYLKHEDDGKVLGRYKWVRASFLSAVVDSGSHWLARRIVPNRLAPGVDLFAP